MEDLELVSYKNTNDKKSETEVKTTNGKGKGYTILMVDL